MRKKIFTTIQSSPLFNLHQLVNWLIGAHWCRLAYWCTLVQIGLLGYWVISPPEVLAALRVCDPQSIFNPAEPHPLRPFPEKDCTPVIEQKARLSCGTDLVAVKKVNLPRGGSGCTPANPAPGAEVQCKKDVTVRNIPIAIGLSNLELPVAGVGSNTAVSDALSESEKMGQYTSWYLEGALEQADQEPIDYTVSGSVDHLLNYAGPIKKLIPDDLIDQKRGDMINAALSGVAYNEIIGYVKDNKVIGRKAARELLLANPRRTDVSKIRLSDMNSHRNPPYSGSDTDAIKWYTLWQQTPFVQTVDIPGEVFATLSESDPLVKNATLTVTSPLPDLRVHFPHLVEVDQLSQILQDVFRASEVPETGGFQETRDVDYRSANRRSPFNTNYCNPDVSVWNPGDSLEATQTIRGSFSFTKTVEYSFHEFTAEERAHYISNGIPVPTTVEEDVSAPVSIFARNPLEMDRIYDRLVNGPSGIYKALSPIEEEIEDEPAAAALSLDCGPGCTVSPGNEAGRKAELFFPHWGTISKTFHEKLQAMLDPISGTNGGNDGGRNIPAPPGFESSSPYATMDIEAAIAAAAARDHIPVALLHAIYEIEGTEFARFGTCVASFSGARGPMQIIDAPGSAYWAVTTEQERQILNLCNPGDAAESAARILKYKVHQFTPGDPTAGSISPTDFGAIKYSALGYYGYCHPDPTTEGRWGTGIGYCDYVMYRTGFCSALTPQCDGE